MAALAYEWLGVWVSVSSTKAAEAQVSVSLTHTSMDGWRANETLPDFRSGLEEARLLSGSPPPPLMIKTLQTYYEDVCSGHLLIILRP